MIAKIQVPAHRGGDEHRGDALVEAGAVHVDRRTDWQDEARHLLVDSDVLLHAPNRDRKGGSRGARTEREQLGRDHGLEEPAEGYLGENLQDQGVDAEPVDQQ